MAIEITIPRLGWSMEEGIFSGWLKRDGDAVQPGDPLFSLEGEKATQDVEAIDAGLLKIPANAPATGETVLVGSVIGYLLHPGETAPSTSSPSAAPSLRNSEPETELFVASAPRVDKPRSSPLARRLAREHGIDWTQLSGSGVSGRVRKFDVLAALVDYQKEPQPGLVNSVPLSPIRRTIAAKLSESCRTTAPVTLTTRIDATNLVGLRQQFKAGHTEVAEIPGYGDFLVKLTAIALRDHPLLHAQWRDGRIVLPSDAAIGIAVDTEVGLLVPVIQGAGTRGIREIAALSRQLIQRARAGQLRPAEMQGGTFTITNLGAFGIEFFTPIINMPECAVLGVGKIERQPVIEGEKVVGRERMCLSLTFDHRIVDGAPAARFLQHLTRLLENPSPWLMS